MDKKSLKCLMIYPKFTNQTFWNYRETCELVGAKYPTTPLGLVTVATMFPESWQIRLRDLNVEEYSIQDVTWADLIFMGGMIFQQQDHLRLIDTFKDMGKKVVVGGPDPTSSPHLYDKADHLVLGEAEITLPEFLADFTEGKAQHKYAPGERKADMAKSPLPRFDLLKFKNYLNVGIQWNRGCPFQCEFCDIIELFGRVPRGKSPVRRSWPNCRSFTTWVTGATWTSWMTTSSATRRPSSPCCPISSTGRRSHRWPFEFSHRGFPEPIRRRGTDGDDAGGGFQLDLHRHRDARPGNPKATQKRQNTQRSIADSVPRSTSTA